MTSKGLEALHIDFNQFNMRPLIKNKIVLSSMHTFNKTLLSIQKVKKDYKKELVQGRIEQTRADEKFWYAVNDKAASLGIGTVGFAPVDENVMFVRDHVGNIEGLYPNGIVLGMEMDFERINKAPEPEAGVEAMEIYMKLGTATNILADFIRSQGHRAIACHPLGGPILFPVMAVRANMGVLGRHGLLITKEYGPRLRLSMIATTASPLPENAQSSTRIEEFCKKCGKCIRSCPVGAIREVPLQNKVFAVASCVDYKKCMPYFYEHDGCSVCIKACPFNQKGYERIIGNC
ncbi:MAG: 4Fe-4S dicluster domain-containing protein [Pseudomonadota bacterium]